MPAPPSVSTHRTSATPAQRDRRSALPIAARGVPSAPGDRVLASAAMSATGEELGARLRDGDLAAAPAVLNLVESRAPAQRDEIAALLHARLPRRARRRGAGARRRRDRPARRRQVLAARRSSCAAWRARGRSVAVLAVDPSSKRSGGALLGDRARIVVDPARRAASSSARWPPAGASAASRPRRAPRRTRWRPRSTSSSSRRSASASPRPRSPRWPIRVAVVVQPGGGDVLQFLKSGIMEIPDVLVVTKADLGPVALRSRRDLSAALRSLGARETKVVAVQLARAARRLRRPRRGARRAPRRASTSRRAGSPRAAPARSRTSSPSTASAGCARSAGGGRRCKLLDEQDAALDVPALTRALERRRRHERSRRGC